MKLRYTITALIAATALTACSSKMDQIAAIGIPPPLNEVSNPVEQADYSPVTWPLPDTQAPEKEYAGSLWQQGSRHFFRDQRAARVGDIVRVKIEIRDKAELENETTRERRNSETVGAPNLFGLEDVIYGALPGGQDPASLLSIDGRNINEGTGTVEREEIIETQVAAIVTQLLPNGNMVVKGSQEIRVNFEVREVSVAGVIRPEDIDSDNTIDSTKVAQARISYGGRGQITDVQQPRWGNQVIDILSPF